MALITPAAAGADGRASVVAAPAHRRRRATSPAIVMLVLLLVAARSHAARAVRPARRRSSPTALAGAHRPRPRTSSPARSARDPATAGIWPGHLGSFCIALVVVVLAFPLGVGAAIYLEEYARPNRLTRFIDVNIRNLAGVPSVVYGILGLIIFVEGLEPVTGGRDASSRPALTLAVLVLPIVIITSIEAIRAVPAGPPRGRLRRRRHPVGGHPRPRAALRRARHPHRHGAGARPGARRGGAADPGRRDHRPARCRRRQRSTEQLHGRFTAMPIIIYDWAEPPGDGVRAGPTPRPPIIVLLVVVLFINTVAILLRNHYEKNEDLTRRDRRRQ